MRSASPTSSIPTSVSRSHASIRCRIRSGLLIRELALRGLAERILIVCPANLALDVTHADGATAGQSAYVRVEVPEPAPEPEPVPVPALPFLDWAIEWVIRQAQSLLRR